MTVQKDRMTNCFGIPEGYNEYAIHQGPDDLFYASISAATWDDLREKLDYLPATPASHASDGGK